MTKKELVEAVRFVAIEQHKRDGLGIWEDVEEVCRITMEAVSHVEQLSRGDPQWTWGARIFLDKWGPS